MNPIWLVVWLSSISAGNPTMQISSFTVFYDTNPMVNYVIDHVGEFDDYKIFDLNRYYKFKSDLAIILEKHENP